jgi:hypothetical protein
VLCGPWDFEAVARAHARAAEENLVVRIRIIETQPVDEEQRLVRIRPAEKQRIDRPARARGEVRRSRHPAERGGERGRLPAREVGGGDDVDRRADGLRRRRRARGRGDHGFQLLAGAADGWARTLAPTVAIATIKPSDATEAPRRERRTGFIGFCFLHAARAEPPAVVRPGSHSHASLLAMKFSRPVRAIAPDA